MSKKDTSKQDIRNLLLKNGNVIPSSYVKGSSYHLNKEESRAAAIQARRLTFKQVPKEG